MENLTNAQIRRRIAMAVKLRTFAQRKRRPARVRHYDRQITALRDALGLRNGTEG